jgi:hypothetical protein
MTNFSKNFKFLFQKKGYSSQGVLSSELKIDRSILSKLLNGVRNPTPQQRICVAKHFDLNPSDFDREPAEFADMWTEYAHNTDLVFASFRTAKKNKIRHKDVFERYQGEYIVYYSGPPDVDTVLASLLQIKAISRDGIVVNFINPYRDLVDNISVYEYAGYMFPVSAFLYFYLEQNSSDYELLSLIVHESRSPKIGILKGMIAGVGVSKETSRIAARSVVVLRRQRQLDNWRKAIGRELGFMSRGKVPEIVRKNLDYQHIDVAV